MKRSEQLKADGWKRLRSVPKYERAAFKQAHADTHDFYSAAGAGLWWRHKQTTATVTAELIVKALEWCAQRIEELEAEVEELKRNLQLERERSQQFEGLLHTKILSERVQKLLQHVGGA